MGDLRVTNHEPRTTSDGLGLWWRAVRPFAFPASVVPALLGTVIAWSEGTKINYGFALLAFIGAVVAHSGANLINDYIDYRRGVDRPGTYGGSGVIVDGSLSARAILIAAVVAFAIAALFALPLCIAAGMPLVWLVIAGFALGAGYVLPPLKLKYRALGDVAVFSAFGVGITLGSYMAQTLVFSWAPVFYAIPFGLLVSAIVHSNNFRDLTDDAVVHVRTFAGVIGAEGSRILYASYFIAAYALVAIFIVWREILPGAAAVAITIPLSWKVVSNICRLPSAGISSAAMAGADAKTAEINLAFGLSMIVGIVGWKLIAG